MIIFILMLVFTIIVTGAAIAIASYAGHITDMVSGDKLLYMEVDKGYKYAMTYRDWQLYGNIAVAVAIVVWIIFIFICISKIRKKRKLKKENMINNQ